ncbi:MAG: ATP synthase F1 subunit delta [Candidatus Omnitrophica bacterium]|nr:ATP synthase F1 subunit delta [Candidatus Omnitrophota bacterium]
MDNFRLVKRYALALLNQARKSGEEKKVSGDLAALQTLVALSPDILEVFASPRLAKNDKDSFLEKITTGSMSELTADFLGLLIQKKRIGLLPEIVSAFTELLKASQGLKQAHVCTAVELEPDMRARVIDKLKKLSGWDLEVEFAVDPRLLGGIEARIGNQVVDSTVRTGLDSLRRRLSVVKVDI